MTARDSRGRFVSPDAAAAERVLQRAVEEAIDVMRRGIYRPARGGVVRNTPLVEAEAAYFAEQALLHAAHAAEPLLRGGAA